MPAKAHHILEAFLEDIHGDVLQEYPDFIRTSIKGRSGIYVLYREHALYYVGLATNLMGRLKQHLKDRHERRWDRFSVYLTARSDAPHIRELEALLLRIVKPRGNRVKGRLRQAANLYAQLSDHMKREDEHRRALRLGGVARKRLQRRTTNTGKGAKALDRVVSRSTPLRGRYADTEYRALFRVDGQLRVDGTLYDSPSAAARACTKRTMNGWQFWKVRVKGEWVPLATLRR